MKLRGTFLWLKIALVIISIPLIGYASSFYTSSYIDTWRNIEVTLDSDYPVVSFGDDYHNYVTFKNISDTTLSVPLDSQCHTGYKLLDRNKRVIREKSFANGSCINFEYNDLRLVPGEYIKVDFYIGNLEPGIYRAVFEVPPRDDMIVDFEVLDPVNLTSGIGGSCQYSSRKTCEEGLTCNFDGVLPGEPGVCIEPVFDRLNYIPDAEIDYVQWQRKDYVQEQPRVLNGFSSYSDSYGLFDGKSGYVYELDFEKYMKVQTGRDVDVNGSEGYVRRDVALTALYRTMYRNRHPEDLKVYKFKDSKWSQYGNYIEASAEKGFIDLPESRIFAIDGWLTWEELRRWESRF